MTNKTSIIINRFDQTTLAKHITYACMGNLFRFTDREDFELIIVDNRPDMTFKNDYNVFDVDLYIKNDKDIGFSASMNLGAGRSSGDVLCFMQTDVFVWEGWLKAMRHYIDNGLADVVFPDQIPHTREWVKDQYGLPTELAVAGWRDAGMIMMSRESFDKTGGWDEEFGAVFQDRVMFQRIGKAGLREVVTTKALVTHIMGGTNFSNEAGYDKKMEIETEILNKKRKEGTYK